MKAKAKGTRIEREIVKRHEDAGIPVKRVPWSGAIGSLYPEYDRMKGDVRILPATPDELTGEVKARANGKGFVTIEKWLGDNDVLFLRRDRQPPFVVLPWGTYERLMKAYSDGSQNGIATEEVRASD